LILKGEFWGYTHPPVFWEKRLQAIENKGKERRKRVQEAASDRRG
jgi:hypothetical protein